MKIEKLLTDCGPGIRLAFELDKMLVVQKAGEKNSHFEFFAPFPFLTARQSLYQINETTTVNVCAPASRVNCVCAISGYRAFKY